MSREGASSIHPKSPLLRPWSEKLEQACLVQTLLGALHERKGKEGVKKSKKKKGDASDAKSLEDIRTAGGAKKTQEARLPIMGLLVHIAMSTPITLDFLCAWIWP